MASLAAPQAQEARELAAGFGRAMKQSGMKTYSTSQVARQIGIHPNTVRLYEELGLIPRPGRTAGGYRIFTNFHLEQFKLARTALKVEVLQNGLRRQAIGIVKASAAQDFDRAILLTHQYLQQISREQRNAEEAISITEDLLAGDSQAAGGGPMTRKAAAEYLQITMDALRNWEMNGLLTVKRRQNGYRVYADADIRRLKIIRALRCANYSLASILRMLNALSRDPDTNIREVINSPQAEDDIISVCDRLLTSLRLAEMHGKSMLVQLDQMKSLRP